MQEGQGFGHHVQLGPALPWPASLCRPVHISNPKAQLDGACSDVQDGQAGDGGLVYSWAQHRLCLYLGELRQHLPRISEG